MQKTHPSPAEITAAITESIVSLPKRMGDQGADRKWTKQLKDDIGSLGQKHEWAVCASGFPDRFDPGWLYDLVWYCNDSGNYLSEVYLVLESEWGLAQSAIKYDFEKLLLAKATFKVMVFQAYDKNISGIFNLLEHGIKVFQKRSVDETYILAGYNLNTEKFDVRSISGA
ncbi:MAG: hypothetical protein WAO21_08385 [Verrucomicrobiia bacterium]